MIRKTRTEHDSMGDVLVPADAYFGAQTQRAVENFPISGWKLPATMISAMGLVKYACGIANRDLGKLTGSGNSPLSDAQVSAMLKACEEIAGGELTDQFPIDVFQTGSGTSSSSIMPGKVNPVMCESMMQLSARVMGNDTTMTIAGASGGNFQLNIMMPLMASTILESIHLLSSGTEAFVEFCLEGMQANEAQCEASVEQSLAMCTSLNPLIGYEQAAKLAKEAMESGKTIREICREQGILPEDTLTAALDPWKMTEPQA